MSLNDKSVTVVVWMNMFTVVDVELPSCGQLAEARSGSPRILVLAMGGSGIGAGSNRSACG